MLVDGDTAFSSLLTTMSTAQVRMSCLSEEGSPSRGTKSLSNNQIVGNSPKLIVEFLGILFICVIAYQLVLKGDGFISAIPTLGALALGAQRLLPAMQIFYFNWIRAI